MKKDITTKDLLSNCDAFADIANVNLFEGKQVILPEDLTTVPLESSYKDMEGKYHRLFRDSFMQVKKLGGCIAFIGFENHVEKHSAYTKVLHEEQKLMPIATFVLYFGEEEWEKPLSLMDILDIPEDEKDFWDAFIHDYKIHVIHMVGQSKEVRKKYCSDYGVIADYLACYKDKNALEAFSNDKRFRMIKQHYIESENKEECDRMCLLLDICEERGMEQGKKEQSYVIAKRLLTVMDVPTIAEMTGLSVDEVESLALE